MPLRCSDQPRNNLSCIRRINVLCPDPCKITIFSRMKALLLPLVFNAFAFGIQPGNRIEPAGRQLKEFYFSLDVEHLWIAGNHVNWETGEADKPDATAGNHTHCSA